MKSISNCSSFLSFKDITHAYLPKISITHNKKRIPLLNLLINWISAKSAPQILSIKSECTFPFSNFPVIDLRYSSANSLFVIYSFLASDLFRVARVSDRASVALPPEVFFIKTFVHHWSKSTLIITIFLIFSNIKCFIRQYFNRSCSSS